MVLNIRGAVVAASAAICLACAGCGGGSTGSSNAASGGTSGSVASPSTTSPAGQCTGRANEAYDMKDLRSCDLQGGKWNVVHGDCEPPPTNPCTSVPTYEPGTRGDYGKLDCVTVLGCTWVNPDGSTEANPDLGATCGGAPKPCNELGKLDCHESNGCKWFDQSAKEVCGNADMYENTQPACSSRSYGTDIRNVDTHPGQVKYRCLSQPGCTWTRADGTVFDHL